MFSIHFELPRTRDTKPNGAYRAVTVVRNTNVMCYHRGKVTRDPRNSRIAARAEMTNDYSRFHRNSRVHVDSIRRMSNVSPLPPPLLFPSSRFYLMYVRNLPIRLWESAEGIRVGKRRVT